MTTLEHEERLAADETAETAQVARWAIPVDVTKARRANAAAARRVVSEIMTEVAEVGRGVGERERGR